jgi:MFS superfamily sulfate permease-like transporter
MKIVDRVFPFLGWFKAYRAGDFRVDIVSGITVALVLIPQSMAYAQLAGLPVYYGLYASFLPPMIAALFGSSRQLATGPVAVVSLMTAAALEPLARAGSSEYIAYAILLAFLIGLFQFLLGIFRLGLVVNFLSHPVINGFTNAAALIIATSQLSKIFGVTARTAEHHYVTVYRVVVDAFHVTHWGTLGMAILSFATMIILKRVNRKIPNVLVAVLVTTVLAWATGFEKNKTVDISSLGNPEVREMIVSYNEVMARKSEAEALRTELNKSPEKRPPRGAHESTCTRCHSQRRISQFQQDSTEVVLESGANALSLHHSARLFDGYIAELKEHSEELREELALLNLSQVAAPGDTGLLFKRGTAPEGLAATKGIWRLKVKNAQIPEHEISLSGGGSVVGTIPSGLPSLAVPDFEMGVLRKLLLMAIVISLLGFMEAISIAKAMAARTNQRLDANQELIGQGLANLAGCMSQSYAVSGSFSRSAVNLQSGAVTGLSNVFSSLMVAVTLLFFTPILYHLPQAVLASIIMMAVVGLLNVQGFLHAWHANKFDGITAVVCFVATLFFAPHLEWGIAIGVVLSLGAYLFRTMRPHVAELSLHPDGSMRDAYRHRLELCKHIAAVRFDGPLNFASTNYLEDEILSRVAEMPHLKIVLIVAHGINEIDASGEEMLSHVVDRMREAGYEVVFSGVKDNLLDVMKRTRLYEKIGEKNFYPTQSMAITAVHERAHTGSSEKECPLLKVVPARR